MTKRTRAILLFGGGLDSLVARAVVAESGVDAIAVHFDTGFLSDERRSVARAAGESVDVHDEYLRSVVLDPKFGYGSAMNPCLDCRVFMLRRADVIARERGGEFLATGEVLGQRAIDQSRHAFTLAEREAGVEGRVWRPLSAGLLEPTIATGVGRLDAEPPLRIAGSRRRQQLDLAAAHGISDCPTASGRCCRLADPVFARRLRDLFDHRDGPPDRVEIERLTRGRHFRLAWNLKLIVARDEEEGAWLEERSGRAWLCRAVPGTGALALLEGTPNENQLEPVGSFVARYSKKTGDVSLDVEIRRGSQIHRVRCSAAGDRELAQARI